MLHHVVLIELNDDTTDEQVVAVLDGLAALRPAIPEIRSLACGRDAGISETAVGLSFVATFDSSDDYQIYRTHPAHGDFARDLLRPVAKTVTISQFDADAAGDVDADAGVDG